MEQREYVVADDRLETLRLEVPAAYIAVIDAIIGARGGSQVVGRSKLLVPVIGAWVEQHIREANMVVNVLRGNSLLEQVCRTPSAPPADSTDQPTTIVGLSLKLDRLLAQNGMGREPEPDSERRG